MTGDRHQNGDEPMSTLMTRVGEGAGTGGVVTAGPGHRAGHRRGTAPRCG